MPTGPAALRACPRIGGNESTAAVTIQAAFRSKAARRQTYAALRKVRVLSNIRLERPKESMELFVLPDVALQIEVSYPVAPQKAGTFTVTGPPPTLKALRRASVGCEAKRPHAGTVAHSRPLDCTPRSAALGESSARSPRSPITGTISPRSPVTLPTLAKRDAGIPQEAQYFAFVYPLRNLKRRLHAINLAKEPWAFACVVGAFAYFDGEGQLLAVNALSIVPAPSVLRLVGPYPARQRATLEMAKNGRMDVVTIDGLLDAGFCRFGWVHPSEQPGGQPLSDSHASCPHGGFVYEMRDGTEALFVLDVATDFDRSAFDANGMLGNAFTNLQQVMVEAFEALEASRFTNGRSRLCELVRQLAWLALTLAATFGLSCALLMPLKHWSAIDAIYFTVITVSTVGYGDLTIGDDNGWLMLANVLLIFVGILVVAARLTAVITLLTHPFERWAGRRLDRLLPSRTHDTYGRATLPPAYAFYLKMLLPEILLNMLIQLGAALVYSAVEGMPYSVAIFHCIVTATTVGYGTDPSAPTSAPGRVVAIVHVLLSVSMVGNAISFIDNLRSERAKDIKRVEALNRKLDKPLLETLERRAATLRPELARHADGLTELEFVICMALELRMVELPMLQPFIDQFRALDVLGNGRLGMNDLNAQKDITRKLGRARITLLARRAARSACAAPHSTHATLAGAVHAGPAGSTSRTMPMASPCAC